MQQQWIHSTSLIVPTTKLAAVYDLLTVIEPGLFVDAGAAAGHVTRTMLSKSPSSRVAAFEPFQGNIPHFRKTIGDDSRVVLHTDALSDSNGEGSLFVSSVVQKAQGNYGTGYSSHGKLVESDACDERYFHVKTRRLDSIIDTRIRFLKLDVQGAEGKVLRGAGRLLEHGKIDMILFECSNDIDSARILHANGFTIFDAIYLISEGELKVAGSAWRQVGEVVGSTARKTCLMLPVTRPSGFDAYFTWLLSEKQRIASLSTDLLAVHSSFISALLMAGAKLRTLGSRL